MIISTPSRFLLRCGWAALALLHPGGFRPACAQVQAPAAGLWDAHAHLSLYGAAALDSLVAHGVVAVRDLGGDLETTLRWRAEIAEGRRRGPTIYTAGVILDGPKEGATPRWTLRTPAEAEAAVDSLAGRQVDFIKTHNALAPAVYFAVLRRARLRGLRVATHLPRGVPAWVAADSGVGSIEHAAESLLASPIYAGYAGSAEEAMDWWRSAAGDSALRRLARTGVSVTPTLAAYAANVDRPAEAEARLARRGVLTFLVELTRRMYLAGITLMAGSDLALPGGPIRPGASLLEELAWLRRAGLPEAAVRDAASRNLARWLGRTPRPDSGMGRPPLVLLRDQALRGRPGHGG